MRDLKFRAFNTVEHKMYPVFMIDFEKDQISVEDRYYTPFQPLRNYDVMQFTGLLDKNGKEIYEGDIIEITTTFHTINVAIKYIEESARFGFDDNDPDEYGLLDEWEDMEIIGNIYSNPELLKS